MRRSKVRRLSASQARGVKNVRQVGVVNEHKDVEIYTDKSIFRVPVEDIIADWSRKLKWPNAEAR